MPQLSTVFPQFSKGTHSFIFHTRLFLSSCSQRSGGGYLSCHKVKIGLHLGQEHAICAQKGPRPRIEPTTLKQNERTQVLPSCLCLNWPDVDPSVSKGKSLSDRDPQIFTTSSQPQKHLRDRDVSDKVSTAPKCYCSLLF